MSHVGWDDLLKTRSTVFVMEEEYRMQKAQVDTQGRADDASDTVIHEDGSVRKKAGADDNASTRAVVSPQPAAAAAAKTNGETLDAGGIPTIRISTDSDHEREQAERRAQMHSPADSDSEDDGGSTADGAGAESDVGEEAGQALERPVQAAAGAESGDAEPHTPRAGGGGSGAEQLSFSNKRLCERWLDNLFMVLYEVRC